MTDANFITATSYVKKPTCKRNHANTARHLNYVACMLALALRVPEALCGMS